MTTVAKPVATNAEFWLSPSVAGTLYPRPEDFSVVRLSSKADPAKIFEGVHTMRWSEPVDLRRPDGLAALSVIRDATARGIVTDWELVRPAPEAQFAPDIDQTLLAHLYPPRAIDGDPSHDWSRPWREGFFIGKLVYRHGPGFIQVRDRRGGKLELYVIDEARHLNAIGASARGCSPAAIDQVVLAELLGARLVLLVADRLLWLPYRIQRWPLPPMAV
ncbi:MAG: DUF5825 family protein [Actinomycetota bacterium]|nr:DUF5825 family protein [Actinomycetota bacterium]MDQ2957959.1 DUF5825 family protein [Actinomycetota bacterium]